MDVAVPACGPTSATMRVPIAVVGDGPLLLSAAAAGAARANVWVGVEVPGTASGGGDGDPTGFSALRSRAVPKDALLRLVRRRNDALLPRLLAALGAETASAEVVKVGAAGAAGAVVVARTAAEATSGADRDAASGQSRFLCPYAPQRKHAPAKHWPIPPLGCRKRQLLRVQAPLR
uniref:Uncharacterized protein n=1 Tax=Prymnesium polylepis TaxID=72548 RepID=A0A7S4I457_9EUKA|mmetsp:Transcript_26192/g.64970  ORF Transcript_26192/g.64970 Transcript_26192/m.64970 type:complete len:176 (+) Transcript_26192:197-724(+)